MQDMTALRIVTDRTCVRTVVERARVGAPSFYRATVARVTPNAYSSSMREGWVRGGC